MISGTIYQSGKMLEMTQKWEQKKASGNILQKEVQVLTPEEQQFQMYKEQLEKQREGNEYSTIYAKLQSGKELSPAEEDKLRAKDPKLYMEYKADQMEQKAYEKRLKNCKTKEEAEKLHVNRLNGKLSELKSIMNNPNIPKSEKLKEAQRILGDTTKTVQIFHTFTESTEFKKLPTEEEKMQSEQVNDEFSEEKVTGGNNAETMVEDNGAIEFFEKEQQIVDEISELEKEHFGEYKKEVHIDIVL